MRKEVSTIYSSSKGEFQQELTYYNLDDLDDQSIQVALHEEYSFVETGACPICGWKTILNGSNLGYFAWCSICGLEGPKNWNAYTAAKMFVKRDLKTVVEARGLSLDHLKSLNRNNFSNDSKRQLDELIKEDNNND